MPITEDDMAEARKNWGDGLIAISKAFEAEGIDGARTVAEVIIDGAYGYNLGPVMFKPTLASGEYTFRPTRKGALSYFIGQDRDYPLDQGFGLRGWRKVTSQSSAHLLDADVAMWMGSFNFTDKNGDTIRTDKSFGYKRDVEGRLRIVLHHSSLPYQPG